MLENLLPVNAEGVVPTGGQVIFDVAGTYEWTVPEGVNEISILAVRSGTGGRYNPNGGLNTTVGGTGGSLRYLNRLSVTPGNSLIINVPSGGTDRQVSSSTSGNAGGGNPSVIRLDGVVILSNGSTIDDTIGGATGEVGQTSHLGATLSGGRVAKLLDVDSGNTGRHLDLTTGLRAASGVVGGGGNVTRTTNPVTYRLFKGGDGGVKIIWGENRAFPDLNVHNI